MTVNTARKYKPGITTVLKCLQNAQALKIWANKLGLEGIKVTEFVSREAEAGKLIHKMVEHYLKIGKVDYAELRARGYKQKQIDYCYERVKRFIDWSKENDFQVIETEMNLESDRYSGRIDLYCELNGKKTIIDIKTSKEVYSDAHTQVVAGGMLLQDNNFLVEDYKVIRIGRSKEEDGLDVIQVENIELHQYRFTACLNLYYANEELNNCFPAISGWRA